MAESDSNSASSSCEDQKQNEESRINELEVRIRPALPYQDIPVAQVAHTTKHTHTMKTKTIFLWQPWRPDLRIMFLLMLGKLVRLILE